MRILCDFLCILGFLNKGRFAIRLDTRLRRVPQSQFAGLYLGGALEFLLSPDLIGGFKNLAESVRKGGTVLPDEGTVAPENPVWVKFARAMAPMMAMPAQLLAKLVDEKADRKLKVLDIAAGHRSLRNRICEEQSAHGSDGIGLAQRARGGEGECACGRRR
mgnify:CR=1 FL=1